MDASHLVLDTPTDIGAPWSQQHPGTPTANARRGVDGAKWWRPASNGRVAKRPRSRMSPMRPLRLVVPRI